jgi:hypothetical protein
LSQHIDHFQRRRRSFSAFIAHFANVLKKHYPRHTFAQIESAFEYNSLGYLNEYLPKVGMSVDNKVKYTIPDILKIVKAFSRYKGIGQEVEAAKAEMPAYERVKIYDEYCGHIHKLFDEYADGKEKNIISVPGYMAKFLANMNLISHTEIDYSEPPINLSIGKNKTRYSKNAGLVFSCFDRLLSENQHISYYLKQAREKLLYTNELGTYEAK